MQRSHRNRHRWLWLFLAPLALAALLYAVTHRQEMPVMDELPDSMDTHRKGHPTK